MWTLPEAVRSRDAIELRTALLLGFLRGVVRRELRTLAEEIFFELVHPELLPRGGQEIDAVLVDDHLRVLEPEPPSLLRHVVEDALAQGALQRRLLEAFHFFPELHALNSSSHACHLT